MDHVFGAALRHVAIDASGVYSRVLTLRVALTARSCIVLLRGWDVRIVARGAAEFAITLQETLRAPEAVGRTDDLELVLPASSRRVVEVEDEITERLTGLIGKRGSFEALNRIGQRKARRFQMADHATFQLALRAEPCRIHDCGTNRIALRSGGSGQLHVAS